MLMMHLRINQARSNYGYEPYCVIFDPDIYLPFPIALYYGDTKLRQRRLIFE